MFSIPLDWAPLVLRIALGAVFIVHGYPKLFKDFKGTAGFLSGIGFKPGVFWALVLGAAEFFGGIAMLIGFLTEIAAGLLTISMTAATLVKIFKWKVPFTKGADAGWEWDLVILAGLIALVILGPGRFAVSVFW